MDLSFTNMRYYITLGIYCLLILSFYTLNNYFHFFELGFNVWDVCWYKSIMENGYNYIEGQQSNTAFFPLFPYLWKFTKLELSTIAVLNLALFGIAICLLASVLKFSLRFFIFLLCFPLNVFFFIPYSESCFFLSITLLFIGILKENNILIILGIVLASLTRPVFPAFIGICIVTLILIYYKTDDKVVNRKKIYLQFFIALVFILLSFGLVNWIQYDQTGIWFAQSKTYINWGGKLSLPELPLTSFEQMEAGYFVLQLDYLSMLWCMYCTYLTFTLIKRVAVWDKYQFFFVGCSIFMLTIFLLRLFTMQGCLWSLSRYIFATPFFIYSLWFALNHHKNFILDVKKSYWSHFFLTILFIGNGIPLTYLKFSTVITIHTFIWPYYKFKWSQYVWLTLFWLLCIGLFIVQLFLLRCFHKGLWIG